MYLIDSYIKKISLLIGMFLVSHVLIFGQNTLSIGEQQESPKATLEDIAWLAGHWRGEALGGTVEELWSSPLGHSMMGSFKLVVNDKVKLYEIETISEVDQTLILRLKHFHNDLRGWEEKDETIDFKLVRVSPDRLYFDGFTIERVGDTTMNMYVVVSAGDVNEEVKFSYQRVLD